jgi:hypothetical protein
MWNGEQMRGRAICRQIFHPKGAKNARKRRKANDLGDINDAEYGEQGQECQQHVFYCHHFPKIFLASSRSSERAQEDN